MIRECSGQLGKTTNCSKGNDEVEQYGGTNLCRSPARLACSTYVHVFAVCPCLPHVQHTSCTEDKHAQRNQQVQVHVMVQFMFRQLFRVGLVGGGFSSSSTSSFMSVMFVEAQSINRHGHVQKFKVHRQVNLRQWNLNLKAADAKPYRNNPATGNEIGPGPINQYPPSYSTTTENHENKTSSMGSPVA